MYMETNHSLKVTGPQLYLKLTPRGHLQARRRSVPTAAVPLVQSTAGNIPLASATAVSTLPPLCYGCVLSNVWFNSFINYSGFLGMAFMYIFSFLALALKKCTFPAK